jgi:hypothetical protein
VKREERRIERTEEKRWGRGEKREVRHVAFYGGGGGGPKDSGFEGFPATPVRPSGKDMLVKHASVLNNVQKFCSYLTENTLRLHNKIPIG